MVDQAVAAVVYVRRALDGVVFDKVPQTVHPAQVDAILQAEETQPGDVVDWSVTYYSARDRIVKQVVKLHPM